MTGLALVATRGQEEAVSIVSSVALHIAKPQYAGKVRMTRLN
jgi:hypothetical protein